MDAEENERLTRVGPGTPAGEMLRRYWWPIGFSEEVAKTPFAVRILAEDLVLFRDGKGRVGLVDQHCAHRGASLEFGRVEDQGIRCCYHGWLFDTEGRCLDQPAEPEGSTLKDEVRQPAYHTQEVSGFIFAYLGPDPVPLLPKYDLLFRDDCHREIWSKQDHCNWLQRAENGVDPYHSQALHAPGYPQIALKRAEVDFDQTWYGFRQSSRYPGSLTNVSHQIFPSHTRRMGARVGDAPRHYLHFRVPTDDTLTTTFYIQAEIAAKGPYRLEFRGRIKTERGVYERVDDGWWGITSHEQDRAAQESQGLIHDRTREFLGTSDRGVVMFRKVLRDAIAAVEDGRDPIGVIRDPAKNGIIRFDADKNFSDGTTKPPEIVSA